VFIDRWQRRQILLIANFARATLVASIALIALSSAPETALLSVGILAVSINRLVLSALGASVPRVVPLDNVVTANAIAPTLGTLSTVLGAGLGVYLRSLFGGGTDTNDAILIAVAAGLYVMAGSLALRLGRGALGPEPAAELPAALKAVIEVARELGAGVGQIRRHHAASTAFVVTAIQRFCFGLASVTAVLLARNTFSDPLNPDAGLALLAQVVLTAGAGFFVGAVITPELSRYLSPINILISALSLAAITQLLIATPQTKTPLLIGVFFVAISAQVTKVCVDSILQRTIPDEFRGRTFSLYDVVFNVAFVAAASVGALVLPASGLSVLTNVAVAVLYAGTAVVLWWRRTPTADQ
jgi:predicted MFS family arabinose efflux permease